VAHERALADAGVAGDQHRDRAARAAVGERLRQRGQLGLAAEDADVVRLCRATAAAWAFDSPSRRATSVPDGRRRRICGARRA
jgi:hypothetical protein